MIKRKGIFPGYFLLVASGIMTALGIGLHSWGLGLYMKPLIKEFGWTRAQISVTASFARLEGGLEGPLAGIAIDKWGPRVTNLVGLIVFGLGFSAMYFVDRLWLFYVIWLIASAGNNIAFMHPLEAAMANWFVKRRGLMLGLMRSVSGVIVPVLLPVVTWILIAAGWRLAFVIMGMGALLIGIPLTWFFVKPRRPEYYGWLPDGKRVGEETAKDTEAMIKAGVDYATETTGEVEFTVRQAMKGRTFWLFVAAVSFRGMAMSVITIHAVPLLTDLGVDPVVAAATIGTMLFFNIPGRLLFGWLGDRVRLIWLKYMVMLATLVEGLGVFILLRVTSTGQLTNMAWVWAFIVVYGFGFGGNISISSPLRGRYWGRKAYASIQGAMGPFGMIIGMIAPVYAGWVYDNTGSYASALQIVLITLLISFVIMFFVNPPKRPAKIGKVTEFV